MTPDRRFILDMFAALNQAQQVNGDLAEKYTGTPQGFFFMGLRGIYLNLAETIVLHLKRHPQEAAGFAMPVSITTAENDNPVTVVGGA